MTASDTSRAVSLEAAASPSIAETIAEMASTTAAVGVGATQIVARIDRLPMTLLHWRVMAILMIAYSFEFCDLYTFSYAAPVLIREWGIDVETVAFVTSIGFVGMFIGAVSGGWIADNIGRKRAIIFATALYAVGSFLNATAWDVNSIALFRFITGLGLSSLTVIANSYIGEFFPARFRGRCLAAIATIGLIAVAATAWFARVVVPSSSWGWRLLFIWGGMGIVILFFTRHLLESPRWQQTRGKIKEAEATLGLLEAHAIAKGHQLPELTKAGDPAVPERVSYGELFNHQNRRNTIFMIVTWAAQSAGFYGVYAWLPTFLYQHGYPVVKSLTYVSVMSLCAPLGAALSHLIIDRVDRKWFVAVDAVVVAALGITFARTSSPDNIMMVGGLLVIALQMGVVSIYTYTPEMFSTKVRASGTGISYGAGRLSNIASPFIVAAILRVGDYTGVFSYIAGCWIVVAILVTLFGPRTSSSRTKIAG